MVTNVVKHICPSCGAEDQFVICNINLIEGDLIVVCQCDNCKQQWEDLYGLFYLGYSCNNSIFDRDGLVVDKQ